MKRNTDVGDVNPFGGSPVAVAAGTAVLDVIAEESLMENAKRQGAYLMRHLRDIQSRFEEVSDVRGAGLFLGVDLCDPARDGAPDAQRTTALIN
ncbi:aminotransferase class III-fold pyridoxal phosphate-dependent enzyme, partial [Pseudoalteromonas sp. SIMBA_148]